MSIRNFRIAPGASGLVNVAATSAAAALPGANAGDTDQDYLMYNQGPADVHFAWGIAGSSVLSDGTATVLPAGGWASFEAPRGSTHIATIADPLTGTSARLYLTRGLGS